MPCGWWLLDACLLLVSIEIEIEIEIAPQETRLFLQLDASGSLAPLHF